MRNLYRALEAVFLWLGVLLLVWFLVSWANVLLTQGNGSTAFWNVFRVVCDCYYQVKGG